MTYLLPAATTLWMVLAAVGGGLAVLRVTGLLAVLTNPERLAISFVTGTGLLGWLVFFPGIAGLFDAASFAVVLVLMTAGLAFLRTPARPGGPPAPFSALEWLALAAIIALMLMDLAEGLTPAADGDTLTYHFETPRQYLASGMIYAVPRATDGVTQLLLQMTYGVALGIGGEKAVPLWTMVSGWALGAVFYVLARRHMSRMWALAGTVCLLTAPAVVYSAGTGQVEARLAALALVAAYAGATAAVTTHPGRQFGWLVLAAVAAGFFAGAKMTGLIFGFALLVAMTFGRIPVARLALFAVVAAAAGAQWYLFNWSETGDPLYPILWKYLDISPDYPWDAEIAASFAEAWTWETLIDRSLGWYLTYPFRTIIAPPSSFESLLTGVGPVTLLCLPFAVAAFVQSRRAAQSFLLRLLIVAFVFHTIWFFAGPSLRVRHYLPVYPLVLLCVLVAVDRFVARRPGINRVIRLGMAAVLCIQLAGHALFTKKFVPYVTGSETREAFLRRNVSGYDVVTWLNGNISENERALITRREWLYLLDVPHYFAHARYQNLITIYPGTKDIGRFVSQLAAQRITHIVIPIGDFDRTYTSEIGTFLQKLLPTGCVRRIDEIHTVNVKSRTLPDTGPPDDTYLIFGIDPAACPSS